MTLAAPAPGLPLIIDGAYVEINGVNLSCFCEEVALTPEVTDVSVTTLCGIIDYPGPAKWHFTAKLAQTFASGSVDATLTAAVEAWEATSATCPYRVIPKGSATVSATNPQFSGHMVPHPFQRFGGTAGTVCEIDIDWICTDEPAHDVTEGPPAVTFTSPAEAPAGTLVEAVA